MPIPQGREKAPLGIPHLGDVEVLIVESIDSIRRIDEQTPVLVSIGLLLPTAALAQVDPNVTASCKDARDFYGCVMAFTTPSQSKADRAPVEAVMGQVPQV